MNNVSFTIKEDINKDVIDEDIIQQVKYLEKTIIPAYKEMHDKIEKILNKEDNKKC
jgi:hypothetical protein